MLVAQNANGADAAKQLDRFLKAFAAIKHLQSSAASQFSNMFIDETVAEFLINRAVSNVAGESREHLREQFPRPEMAQDDYDRPARA